MSLEYVKKLLALDLRFKERVSFSQITLTYIIFFLITILISVAFFTLFERKILGYIHARVGPNKILLSGVGQPFSDLIKLFSRIDISLSFSSLFLYNFSPIFIVLFSMLV